MRGTNTVNGNSVILSEDGELDKDIFFYTKWLKRAMLLSIAWFVPLRSFVSQLSSPWDYAQLQMYGKLSCVKNKQAVSIYLHWWKFFIQNLSERLREAVFNSLSEPSRKVRESSFPPSEKHFQQSHWSAFGTNPRCQQQLQCERLRRPQHSHHVCARASTGLCI